MPTMQLGELKQAKNMCLTAVFKALAHSNLFYMTQCT